MNVLFLSLLDFNTFDERNIYCDLLREFIKDGHKIYCISPVERRKREKSRLTWYGDSCILKLRIGNIQKAGFVEKGISTLSVEPLIIHGIRKYFSKTKFDLVLYTTPPITFEKAIRFVKRRDRALTYLMLKDIFPQNAVDLGVLKMTGLKGFIYRYFRRKEKRLYAVSDRIGCMSAANVKYVLSHNREVPVDKVGICPNCVADVSMYTAFEERVAIREKYGIPLDKKVFVYGGNLGKPQDVSFIVKCLKACAHLSDLFFVIAGSGTDRHVLETYIKEEKPKSLLLLGQVPKEEYDKMIVCCDVGLVFLDHRFTIPNFPSRLLSYMQAGLPVLACTDPNTDVGKIIEAGNFGWQCESDCENNFVKLIQNINSEEIASKGYNAVCYLRENYTADKTYQIIKESIKREYEN